MRLEMEAGAAIEDPSADDIERALASLDGTINGFAILSRDDLNFIQVAGSKHDGFLLEHASDGQQLRALGTVSFPDVVATFKAYAAGREDWTGNYKWEPLPPVLPKQETLSHTHTAVAGFGCVALILAIQVLMPFAVYWHLSAGSGLTFRIPIVLLPVYWFAKVTFMELGLSPAVSVALALGTLFLLLDLYVIWQFGLLRRRLTSEWT